MYQGKHYQKDEHVEKRSHAKKPLAALVALVLILGAVVGGTLAYLAARTDAIVNTFTAAKVTTEIEETFVGSVKSNVSMKNTGDVEAYIRAAYVVTWKDATGKEVYPTQPVEGTDYSIALNLSEGWVQYGGYYYYTLPVAPGDKPATKLTDSMTLTESYDDADGGHQSIDVMAEAIQSVPAEAVGQAWGVSIAQGSVTAYSAGN